MGVLVSIASLKGPGICDIYIHKAVSTENLSLDSADELKDTIFDLINSKVVKG